MYSSFRSVVLMAGLALLPVAVRAGETPQPGDLAMLQANANGLEYAAAITLRDNLDLRGITATDNGWLNTNALRTGEGFSVTSPNNAGWDNVPIGTIIEIVELSSSSHVDNDPSDGFLGVDHGGIAFSTTGDQIFIFTGSSSSPTILCGMTTYRNSWQSNATNANTSALPANGGHYAAVGLTSAHVRDAYYSGVNNPQNPAGARTAIALASNWTTTTETTRFDNRSFTIPTLPVELSAFGLE